MALLDSDNLNCAISPTDADTRRSTTSGSRFLLTVFATQVHTMGRLAWCDKPLKPFPANGRTLLYVASHRRSEENSGWGDSSEN